MIPSHNACYGCGVCTLMCKNEALSIEMSADGFWNPEINSEKCTKCHLCEKVCSYIANDILYPNDTIKPIGYSGITKNKQILASTTSGGIGYELGNFFLKEGYAGVGVIYNNEKNVASHVVVSSERDLKRTAGSKYLQSYTVDAFLQINNGKKYIIFGCPCQIDSLRRFTRISHIEQNFFFVDFFCHGVPSYHLWRKYLNSHLKNEQIETIQFRDKSNGWTIYTMTMTMTNGRVYSKTLKENDFFLNIFLGNYVLNLPCYTCKFHGTASAADIRIGDLWGEKYKNNTTGVSGVIALSGKGKDAINGLSVSCSIHEEDIMTLIDEQICAGIQVPGNRRILLKKLTSNMPLSIIYFIFIYKRWIKNMVPVGIKERLKMMKKRRR
jgi:coenzyme F420-reducing hydrogenase beta subunit